LEAAGIGGGGDPGRHLRGWPGQVSTGATGNRGRRSQGLRGGSAGPAV